MNKAKKKQKNKKRRKKENDCLGKTCFSRKTNPDRKKLCWGELWKHEKNATYFILFILFYFILYYFKSWFKIKTSMLKIALSRGYKIRTSRTGKEFGLWLKVFSESSTLSSLYLYQWGNCLLIMLCFGCHIHHTTKLHGVFLIYIYIYIYIFIYIHTWVNIWLCECRYTYMPMYI